MKRNDNSDHTNNFSKPFGKNSEITNKHNFMRIFSFPLPSDEGGVPKAEGWLKDVENTRVFSEIKKVAVASFSTPPPAPPRLRRGGIKKAPMNNVIGVKFEEAAIYLLN